jgi:hypothetical protein
MAFVIFNGMRENDQLPARIALRAHSVVDLAEFPERKGCILRYRLSNSSSADTVATAFLDHTLDEVVEALNKVDTIY